MKGELSINKKIKSTIVVLLICIFLFPKNGFSNPETKACLKYLLPLKNSQKEVGDVGGLWSLFEKYSQLRGESLKALRLDQKINMLIWSFSYLCETIQGVPFDELASYVSERLKIMDKNSFKKEHLILGKTEEEIDIWLEYIEFARSVQFRTLNPESINRSIDQATIILEQYNSLAKQVGQSPNKKHIEMTEQLIKDINSFAKSDGNISLALEENAKVPYWDIDENYGGS